MHGNTNPRRILHSEEGEPSTSRRPGKMGGESSLMLTSSASFFLAGNSFLPLGQWCAVAGKMLRLIRPLPTPRALRAFSAQTSSASILMFISDPASSNMLIGGGGRGALGPRTLGIVCEEETGKGCRCKNTPTCQSMNYEGACHLKVA